MTASPYAAKLATIDGDAVQALKRSASSAPLLRARINMHPSPTAPLHEMVIAFTRDSLVRPHRHRQKSESFHIIEGEAELLLFDDAGSVTSRVQLGAWSSGRAFYCRIDSPVWHTVIPMTDWLVLHETTGGPFDPTEAEYAPWAPATDDALRLYLGEKQGTLRAIVEFPEM